MKTSKTSVSAPKSDKPVQRQELEGTIWSFGFASGHRIVIGNWNRSPIGAFCDAMVAEPSGRRVLYANQTATEYVQSIYRFDATRVATADASTSSDLTTLEFRCADLELACKTGRAMRLIRRPAWFTRYLEAPAARILFGVQLYGVSPTGVREWYRIDAVRFIAAATATIGNEALGDIGRVEPACNFGFSEPLRRPSAVEVRTSLEFEA